MSDLLFLAHRIPYPPDKGDKIRSWHVLAHLAARYRVHLGCFIDDEADWRHIEYLRDTCTSVCAVPLRPGWRRWYSLKNMITGEALTFAYFQSASLSAWVAHTRARYRPPIEFAFSSAMAPYLRNAEVESLRVVDFVDLDSEKWQQYATRKSALTGWLYRREARLLSAAEQTIATAVDASLFVSATEATSLRRRCPAARDRIHSVENGVDSDYFDPGRRYERPFVAGGPALVFTGAMDYWPNVDAVRWLAETVLPRVWAVLPELRLWVVGSRPTPEVNRLAQDPRITVSGRVPDVRPWLAAADLAVAPLRIGCGVQNKVLEAMAMAKAVVCTSQAFSGIAATVDRELLVADDAASTAAAILDLLHDAERRERIGAAARRRILDRYRWSHCLATLDRVLEAPAQRSGASASSPVAKSAIGALLSPKVG
jgi:sugar transferase (PEP-CTERM/EpsH1 system associated)